jgi:endonuclease III
MSTRAAARREAAFVADVEGNDTRRLGDTSQLTNIPPNITADGRIMDLSDELRPTQAAPRKRAAQSTASGGRRKRLALKMSQPDIEASDDIVMVDSDPAMPPGTGNLGIFEGSFDNDPFTNSFPSSLHDSVVGGTPCPQLATPKRKRNAINGQIVKGGWDELPHNMGSFASATAENPDDSDDDLMNITPPYKGRASEGKIAPKRASRRGKNENMTDVSIKDEQDVKTKIPSLESNATTVASSGPKTRASRAKPRKSQQPTPSASEEGENSVSLKEEDAEFKEEKPKKKRAQRKKKVDTSEDVQNMVDGLIESAEKAPTVKMPKKNKYGLTPGESPYPNFPMPTPEACQEVHDLLTEVHGVVEQPATIPPPSLEVTGCGEVPSVIDALIRTRLSAATTAANSGYAFAGLVEKFGLYQEGIGKGSVNWNKVREADVKEIEKAIHRGGLAASKSKSIKAILDMVYELNIARHDAFVHEKKTGAKATVLGVDRMTQGMKDMEIAVKDDDILSLQFMHGLTADEAMEEFTKFPGIGVKTASCVILFCLRRPSLAVDTHVFRLSQWLKWTPENSTRDKTFSHLEIRVPDNLKYGLHQLFIRHGRTCGRCRGNTSPISEDWISANCPIEHLVERTGKRKGPPGIMLKKGKGKKKTDESDEEEEDANDDMTLDEDDAEAMDAELDKLVRSEEEDN